MVPRFPFFRFVFAAPAIVLAALAFAAPPLATNPAITFFSSLTEEPLARLEAAAISPRYVRHGPFRVPAPGVEIESPTLSLQDQPCTPEDWTRLLKELAAWRQLPDATDFLLTLPDGRSFIFLQSPTIRETSFSGFVRPLAAADAGAQSPASLLLRITHDGRDRLRIDLRPLPQSRAHAAGRSPSETPADDAESAVDENETASAADSATARATNAPSDQSPAP